MGDLIRFPEGTLSLEVAVDTFFKDRDLSPTTRRAYAAAYKAFLEQAGSEFSVSALSPQVLGRFFKKRWTQASPRTWIARIAVPVQLKCDSFWLLIMKPNSVTFQLNRNICFCTKTTKQKKQMSNRDLTPFP